MTRRSYARRRRDQIGHQAIEPELVDKMNAVAAVLDEAFRPHGFALLVFPMGEADGRMNYISSASRDTMVTALKELVARFEGRVPDVTEGTVQ